MTKAWRDKSLERLRKAPYDVEVTPRWLLQVAKNKQRSEEGKMQVRAVEQTRQITLQEQEITRREKELELKLIKDCRDGEIPTEEQR